MPLKPRWLTSEVVDVGCFKSGAMSDSDQRLMQTLRLWRPLAAAARELRARLHNLLRINGLIYYHAEEWEHHFFPRHVAVIDGLIGIRIELVVCRIIKVRIHVQLRSLWHLDGCPVSQLPIEVIVRDTKHSLLSAIWKCQRVGHVLTTKV